jgi:integrase/recombinase XerD
VIKVSLSLYEGAKERQYLFPGRHGHGHINPKPADEILRETCNRFGLVGVSTHSFRRTVLAQMSSMGVPLQVIQGISGNLRLQVLQRYLEVTKVQMEGRSRL